MAILEGLGPKKKMFEDLPPGDYVFEISHPGDNGWIREFVDDGDSTAKLEAINWRLRVVSPEESEGRSFFHRTWLAGTPAKIAKAKRPWDPSSFTYQFLQDIGIALKDGNEAIIRDEFLDNDGWFLQFSWEDGVFSCDTDNLNKTIGIRFSGSLRLEKDKSGQDRIQLTQAWPE